MRKRFVMIVLSLAFGVALNAAAPKEILVEAESFSSPGGWVLDQQSMDVMGSPYLLAHGMGVPVSDAATSIQVPVGGSYHVWVRTRDWVPRRGPGKFQLAINGRILGKVFGADGDGQWEWHRGGTVRLKAGTNSIALKDLTGFEGRCDAVLFVKDAPPGYQPPNELKAMTAWRKRLLKLPDEPVDAGQYDFVVVGGGFAGIGASVSAARLGLRVALIQDRPVLGGNASSEIGVNPIGNLDFDLYPRNADVVKDLEGGNDARQLAVVVAEKNVSLFLNMRVFGVEMRGGRIAAVTARNTMTAKEMRFRAPLFADCTGDATVGFLAGAEWRMGREAREQTGETFAPDKADRQLLGNSIYWRANPAANPSPFPPCPWAIQVSQECYDVPPGKAKPKMPPGMLTAGIWNWESGFNRDPVMEAEFIRDHLFRAIFGVWDFLKNRGNDKEKYANWRLDWVGYVLGKRESRRLIGEYIITQQDLAENVKHPDGCVIATWYVDLHYPHPENSKCFPGAEFRSIAYDDPNLAKYSDRIPRHALIKIKPFPIPYRCFYSRNIPNLFMAGRNISATHVGLSAVRVMNTTAMMGTVVGRAAYLCKKLDVSPRDIYAKHLEEFKALLRDPRAN